MGVLLFYFYFFPLMKFFDTANLHTLGTMSILIGLFLSLSLGGKVGWGAWK